MWNLGILTVKSRVSISGCSWSISLGWLCLGVGVRFEISWDQGRFIAVLGPGERAP